MRSMRNILAVAATLGISLTACVTKSTYLKQVQTADQLAAREIGKT